MSAAEMDGTDQVPAPIAALCVRLSSQSLVCLPMRRMAPRHRRNDPLTLEGERTLFLCVLTIRARIYRQKSSP